MPWVYNEEFQNSMWMPDAVVAPTLAPAPAPTPAPTPAPASALTVTSNPNDVIGRYAPGDYEGTVEQGQNTSNADARMLGILRAKFGAYDLDETSLDSGQLRGPSKTIEQLLDRLFGTQNVYTVYEDRGQLAATVLYVNNKKRTELVTQNANVGDGAAILGIVSQFVVPVIGQQLNLVTPVLVNAAGETQATFSTYTNVASKVATATNSKDLQTITDIANIANKGASMGDFNFDVVTNPMGDISVPDVALAGGASDGFGGSIADQAGNVTVASDNASVVSSFDPFAYSSGEASTAYSDASNVDYGFGAVAPTSDVTVLQGPEAPPVNANYDSYDFNATAESAVSNFGSIPVTPEFNTANIKNLATGIGVANQVAKLGAVNNSVTSSANIAGGGGRVKFNQTVTPTLMSVGTPGFNPGEPLKYGNFGFQRNVSPGASQGSSPMLPGIGSILTQIESVIPKNYSTQLSGAKTTPQARPRTSNNAPQVGANAPMQSTVMYVGVAFLAFAAFLAMKKA